MTGLAAIVTPVPWGGVLLRGADVTVRRSVYRTGYELLYTPLPDVRRRAAKASIDVGWDCAGSGAGAAIVFLLILVAPASVIPLALAAVAVAAAEFLVTRRLGARYQLLLEESVHRRGAALPPGTRYTIDRGSLSLLLAAEDFDEAGRGPSWSPHDDPVPEALAGLRSNDAGRIRAALHLGARDVVLVGAVIPLLGRDDVLDDAARALRAHGPQVAGQLGDALVGPATPEVVRRRIPLVLGACPSRRALEVLMLGLADASLSVRARCGQALLKMTGADATLEIPREAVLAAAGRELDAGAGSERSLRHVFDLLAIVVGHQTMAVARRAYGAGDAQVLGTALAYLETVLPRPLFAKLEHRLLARPLAHAN